MSLPRALKRLIAAAAAAFIALETPIFADPSYFVSESVVGNIWRVQDLNGDDDALDFGEQTLWAQGFVGLRGLVAESGAIFARPAAPAMNESDIVRLWDANSDGDAFDVGESSLWADELSDPTDAAVDGSGVTYISDRHDNLVWRLVDGNADGDALDIGERTLFASDIDGPQRILLQPGNLFVAAGRGDHFHRLLDIDGDHDALDIGENLIVTPKLEDLSGALGDGAGGFYFTSRSSDRVYHAADKNHDGDFLDLAEILDYTDDIYGGLDDPSDMVAYDRGGFLLVDSNHNQLKLVHDMNGDGDALDLGEVVLFADGIDLSAGLLGDYNRDGSVDAADYVVWRHVDGTVAGYDLWREHFGNSAGIGAGIGASVTSTIPEPSTALLTILAAAGLIRWRRRHYETRSGGHPACNDATLPLELLRPSAVSRHATPNPFHHRNLLVSVTLPFAVFSTRLGGVVPRGNHFRVV
jgi:hypothetical protein